MGTYRCYECGSYVSIYTEPWNNHIQYVSMMECENSMERKWKRLDCMFCDKFDEKTYACSKNRVRLSKLESCPLNEESHTIKIVGNTTCEGKIE